MKPFSRHVDPHVLEAHHLLEPACQPAHDKD